MDSLHTDQLALIAIAIIAVGLAATSFSLALVPVPAAPTLGARGAARQRTMKQGGAFGAVERIVRVVAGWIAELPVNGLRASIDRKLVHSGHWLGVTPDELLAMSAIGGVLGGVVGAFVVVRYHMSPVVGLFCALVLIARPFTQLEDAVKMRWHNIERRLPEAVDLLTLCMGAGLDFPAALRRVINDGVQVGSPVEEELRTILDEVELGRTRQRAMEGLAARVPTRTVKDFVAAVVQAEEKGTPLADTLAVQARMLRMRRSVLAEEAAVRAALQLMIPLVMIFAALMMVMMAPLGITLAEEF